ncbi:unnamed protein product [Absidia cylindrospora]
MGSFDIPTYDKITAAHPPWFNIHSLDHWTITIPPHKRITDPIDIPPYQVKTGLLHFYWLSKHPNSRQLPITHFPYDPPPATHLTTDQWRFFWRQPIDHSARNCWWRLLIRKPPCLETLRHIRKEDINPGWCTICNRTTENERHMLFDCPLKLSFWNAAKTLFGIDHSLNEIWDILTFRQKVDTDTMIKIGDILKTVWLQHWHCRIEEVPWHNTHAFRRLRWQLWNKGMNYHMDNRIAEQEAEEATANTTDDDLENAQEWRWTLLTKPANHLLMEVIVVVSPVTGRDVPVCFFITNQHGSCTSAYGMAEEQQKSQCGLCDDRLQSG